MSVNRAPNRVWLMRGRDRREAGEYPNGYVLTADRDEIRVTYFETEDEHGTFFLSRNDARLLAKRINECLDATAKR